MISDLYDAINNYDLDNVIMILNKGFTLFNLINNKFTDIKKINGNSYLQIAIIKYYDNYLLLANLLKNLLNYNVSLRPDCKCCCSLKIDLPNDNLVIINLLHKLIKLECQCNKKSNGNLFNGTFMNYTKISNIINVYSPKILSLLENIISSSSNDYYYKTEINGCIHDKSFITSVNLSVNCKKHCINNDIEKFNKYGRYCIDLLKMIKKNYEICNILLNEYSLEYFYVIMENIKMAGNEIEYIETNLNDIYNNNYVDINYNNIFYNYSVFNCISSKTTNNELIVALLDNYKIKFDNETIICKYGINDTTIKYFSNDCTNILPKLFSNVNNIESILTKIIDNKNVQEWIHKNTFNILTNICESSVDLTVKTNIIKKISPYIDYTNMDSNNNTILIKTIESGNIEIATVILQCMVDNNIIQYKNDNYATNNGTMNIYNIIDKYIKLYKKKEDMFNKKKNINDKPSIQHTITRHIAHNVDKQKTKHKIFNKFIF